VAPELGVLISLTTDVVQVNDLPSLDMSSQLLKTRGAHRQETSHLVCEWG
jgi:hypothetical protein